MIEMEEINEIQQRNSRFKAHRTIFLVGAILCITLFLTGIVSAFNFDNWVSYKDKDGVKDKVVIVENLFGFGKTIAKAELITPKVNNVIRGENRRVMIWEIENYGNFYPNGLKDMEIFNLNNKGKKEDKEYHYEYAIFDDVEVVDKENICEKVYDEINDTYRKVCRSEVIGSHLENRIVGWEILDNHHIPKGNLTVALVTDVEAGDWYDGVPILFGKRVSSWSEWNETLEVDLAAYWKFDDDALDWTGTYNLTNSGVTFGEGLINDGSVFEDDDYFSHTTSDFDFGSGEFTVNVWLNSSKGPTDSQDIIGTFSADKGWMLYFTTGGDYSFYFHTDNLEANDIKATTGVWEMYTARMNSTDLSLWKNGTHVAAKARADIGAGGNFLISGIRETARDINGRIDETSIWNRALTDSEIVQLYNDGAGITPLVEDTTSPAVSIITPTNNTNTGNINLNVNYTVSDETALDSCWWSNDSGGYNHSITCGVNLTTMIWDEGLNTIFIYANDSSNNINDSESVSFTLTTTPKISIVSPTNSTNTSNVNLNINYTVSDDGSDLQACWWSKDFGATNTTLTCGVNLTTMIWDEGLNTVFIYANDSSNNINDSESVSFTLDTTPPTLNITYPIEGATYTTNYITEDEVDIAFNWTAVDPLLQTCIFWNGTGNNTVSCGTNTTSLSIPYGSYSFVLWANDSVGNEDSSSVSATWAYNFYEKLHIWENSTYETKNETFQLNISTLVTILSIDSKFVYNATNYAASASCIGNDCTMETKLDIPLIQGEVNQKRPFYWDITLFDGTTSYQFNSSTKNQTVARIYLEECNATYTNTTLNFTAYDEVNLTRVSPFDFDGTFDFWLGGGTVKRNNSFSSNQTELTLCIAPQNKTFYTDAIISYGDKAGVYKDRNYYFDDKVITNSTQNISLYLLSTSVDTTFILEVEDESLVAVADALIFIQRYYPGEDIYRTVQIARTDENGESVGFFETETVDYKFIIKKAGVTLLETGKQKVVPKTTPYTLTFKIGEGLVKPWKEFEDKEELEVDLFFNKSTNITTFTYTDTSGTFSQARLLVLLENASSDNTIICNKTFALTSGTLTCNITGYAGSFVAQVFITRTAGEYLVKAIRFEVSKLGVSFGKLGIFLGFLVILIAGMAFLWNTTAGIVAINAAIILTNLIGLVSFGLTFIFSVIAISIVLIWLMKT